MLATVRDGILQSINNEAPMGDGQPLVSKNLLSTVWAHATYSQGTVCNMRTQVDLPYPGAEEWEFQPFASNGEINVFFYDKDDQSSQGN